MMGLLLTLTDGADITCLYVPVVLDAIARLFPQNINAFAIDVFHTSVPQVNRLSSQRKTTGAASKLQIKRAQRSLPVASSVPHTFIGKTTSAYSNLGLSG